MEYIVIILALILGTVIGSFLNVVIYRYNTGTTLGGRSMCFSCGTELMWYELFPILSFLLLGGRCRTCKSKISTQYALVELGTGVLFALLAQTLLPLGIVNEAFAVWFIFWAVILSILMVIVVYDLKHKIIPDGFVYAFAILSFAHLFFTTTDFQFVIPPPMSMLAGILIPLPFLLIFIFSQGRLIGFGDIKLMVGIGFALGLEKGFSAVFIAFWIGALVSIFLLFLKKGKVTMNTEVPFAPFLVLGMLLVFFFNVSAFHLFDFVL